MLIEHVSKTYSQIVRHVFGPHMQASPAICEGHAENAYDQTIHVKSRKIINMHKP